MKFLCFSDLHRDSVAAQNLLVTSRQVDIVIGAGDFATRRTGLEDTLNVLRDIEKPTVLVPGNGESAEELRQATELWNGVHVLHGTGCQIAGIDFWGVGGGIPVTPFGDWSYDFDEDQAARMLQGCSRGGVLVVHSPPFDTVDHDAAGKIRGSRSIRHAIETIGPRLVVCGHIHSDWGKQFELGSTTILNAGPAGVILEIQFAP